MSRKKLFYAVYRPEPPCQFIACGMHPACEILYSCGFWIGVIREGESSPFAVVGDQSDVVCTRCGALQRFPRTYQTLHDAQHDCAMFNVIGHGLAPLIPIQNEDPRLRGALTGEDVSLED